LNYKFKSKYLWLVNDAELKELAELYSNHYGVWSSISSYNPGKPIRISSSKIREWFVRDKLFNNVYVSISTYNNECIGYAITVQKSVPRYGLVSWVAQLVVHEMHRNNGVGKRLLFSSWAFSNNYAWGLITASPYAIRALEKATRRRCVPARISKSKKMLLAFGNNTISYISSTKEIAINKKGSAINTNFFVDHTEMDEMIERVTNKETPWLLGKLQEGWEWFAFTFQNQEAIKLTSQEINQMLEGADQITREAYSRVNLSGNDKTLRDSKHTWAMFTEKEVDQIIDYCQISKGNTILDVGCGCGRHAIRLANLGYDVIGVDYVTKFIKSIRNEAKSSFIHLVVGDCRNIKFEQKYNTIICLYDVIGTYANDIENLKILRNIFYHLKDGGHTLISVMNFGLTKRRAKKIFKLSIEPDELLGLAPSPTMETSGEIFNPDYYMIDSETNVVYRKEQFFGSQDELPTELIVRDRRYYKEEIEDMCRQVGLEILWTRFVHAGNWEDPLNHDDENAKEILLLCRKN
jgi:2-polyprenyl-3-methyl-5-hydroxy-6-metoxy-1,4-benzoquinol methylase